MTKSDYQMSTFNPSHVLDFWFLPPEDPGHGKTRVEWYKKSDEFDRICREQFEPSVQAALNGDLNHWAHDETSAEPALALIVLLDQITRNIYRNDPRMVAGDTIALLTAKKLVSDGRDTSLLPVQRQFCYMPFEHAEDLEMQHESLRLFKLLQAFPGTGELLVYAERHAVIIERFGRYPHRNKLLGRVSTPEEIEFLKQPGSGF